jgi:uncharacterized repeat protein (TIGR03843 family)
VVDVVVNNADRKGGHLLLDRSGKLWGIDHGVCFHADDKLRTVIWGYQGQPIPEEILSDLSRLRVQVASPRHAPGVALANLLDEAELQAMLERVDRLLESQRFPLPGRGRRVPWPPW